MTNSDRANPAAVLVSGAILLAVFFAIYAATVAGVGGRPASTRASAHPRPLVPVCRSEDQVVVGTGAYAGGLWTGYRCVQVDRVPSRVACERASAWYAAEAPGLDASERAVAADARAALCVP